MTAHIARRPIPGRPSLTLSPPPNWCSWRWCDIEYQSISKWNHLSEFMCWQGRAKLFAHACWWLTRSFDVISHLKIWLDKDAVILGSTVKNLQTWSRMKLHHRKRSKSLRVAYSSIKYFIHESKRKTKKKQTTCMMKVLNESSSSLDAAPTFYLPRKSTVISKFRRCWSTLCLKHADNRKCLDKCPKYTNSHEFGQMFLMMVERIFQLHTS